MQENTGITQTNVSDDVNDVHASIPEEFAEALKSVPVEERRVIERIFVSQSRMLSRMSPESEVMKKVTADHISTMLGTQHDAMEKTFQADREKRIFLLITIVIVFSVLITVIVLLREQPELMEKVITIAASAGLGLAGGYGLGQRKGKND